MLPGDDPDLALDRQRLAAVRAARQEQAARYFAAQAARWDQVRSLYLDEAKVEAALLGAVRRAAARATCSTSAPAPAASCSCSRRGSASASASTCRARCWRWRAPTSIAPACATARSATATCTTCRCPTARSTPRRCTTCCTLPTIRARRWPRRRACCAPGGRLVVVDFAPHQLEFLRASTPIAGSASPTPRCRDGSPRPGWTLEPPVRLDGDPLTVVIWPARRVGAADERSAVRSSLSDGATVA